MAARRTVGALQLALLDGREADVDVIVGALDEAQLRAVVAEVIGIWREVVRWNYSRDSMRAAVAADALAQAGMPDSGEA
jgi:hypothetical protein